MEATGKVVEALKSRPDFIMLVLLQLGTMYLIYQGAGLVAEQRQARELMLLDRCLDKTDALLP
jgi:hypothetical protein